MRNWKKMMTAAGAMVMAAVMTLAAPMTAKAWDLNGESTQVNNIETKNPSSLITTIQTNYHAFGVTGFVVLTPSTTVDSILGITKDMQNMDGRGILYVANTTVGEKATAVFQAEADKVKGTILWYFDVQLFKYDGTWNEPQTSISSPIKMAIGIGESDRSSKYDYAMIRLHDGVTTLLPDLDDDEYTITFESDKFSTFAMVRYPKGTDISGSQTGSAQQQQPAAPPAENSTPAGTPGTAPSAGSDLDDVPKTGDLSVEYGMALIIAGMVTIACAAVWNVRFSKKRR